MISLCVALWFCRCHVENDLCWPIKVLRINFVFVCSVLRAAVEGNNTATYSALIKWHRNQPMAAIPKINRRHKGNVTRSLVRINKKACTRLYYLSINHFASRSFSKWIRLFVRSSADQSIHLIVHRLLLPFIRLLVCLCVHLFFHYSVSLHVLSLFL